MEHAVYDTGKNYFVCELRNGNPIKGVLVDKGFGSLWDDIESIGTGDVRLGAVGMGLPRCAQMAAESTFLARIEDGRIAERMMELDDDEEWRRYAGV